MTKTAFLFPGQGSQCVGMGGGVFDASAVARSVLSTVELALNEGDLPTQADLPTQSPSPLNKNPSPLNQATPAAGDATPKNSPFPNSPPPTANTSPTANASPPDQTTPPTESLAHIMRHGPDDALRLTRNAQPALMTTALAVIRTLEAKLNAPIDSIAHAVAGHSLGEYAALAATNTIPISTTATLLRLRGDAMQHAVPEGEGAMAALLGGAYGAIEFLLAQHQWQALDIANDNAPGQLVISGAVAEVDKACTLAKEAQACRKAIKLPVSAPFHCRLMAPAADVMAEALAGVTIHPPSLPVWCNITASPVTDPSDLRDNLIAQITGMVRWRETLENMAAAGITRFVEVGTGKVLTGLVKRTLPTAEAFALETVADIDNFLEMN